MRCRPLVAILPTSYRSMSLIGTSPPTCERLSGVVRVGAVLLAFGLAVPLVLACRLKPDPAGHGTHQQLGLPPCTMLVLFGRPCPTCGMTTSWAHLVRGRLGEALRANVGGTMLGLVDLLVVPWLLLAAVRGRWPGGELPLALAPWLAVIVFVVTLIQWVGRLWAA